ncbi:MULTISPECIES: thymidine phosphorylase [Corynebacterium]|uniref:thymidine phosphorylase n=1 Tax=Corynebacterium TaxID=1716 RepID=UPI0008A1EF84|nr:MULTISPECIES: thymidine phosphorylase [Corynebacterium]KAA0881594.1 thymidine phosphorylase [Corynebacterium amycolatum]KAA9246153.1 thymidine phosphorylase [Corynebacterium amycolatum]MBC6764903.1 thymidine phosphorylase [Corynebacterium sp. LK22]MBC6767824.1 thymidine phosphorylase [Corynebacterium sp. LK15]MBC6797553.1 thymidine phosphorylase [Corynebacterium sp. LK31]
MAEKFDVVDVIKVKRDGGELSPEEISWVIDAYTRGVVGDEQMAALNMAIFIRGMNRREIVDWTQAMIDSGETMSFASLSKPTTDKHSTGGVGDKITLPLGPLVSSYGVAVPQLSGRGLGHTGGTLDKLESIPGWQADVPNDRLMQILEDSGAVVAAAGAGLAPADKKIYALRDITSTVDCIPLIASSIMSKKIAEGTSSLVLDVKVGSGAFMKDLNQARELARTMVDLGNDAGVNTRALLTDMSTPLGLTIGNALEVRESVEVLAGGGPTDVVELTCELARNMLELAGVHDADVEQALKDGRAMDSWKKMIRAQGGDPDAALPVAPHTHDVVAQADGYLTKLDALALGVGSWRLGAGRARKDDPVQATAGIEIFAKPGDKVVKGQKLLTLHTETPDKFERALESIEPGIEIGDTAPTAEREIILDRVS